MTIQPISPATLPQLLEYSPTDRVKDAIVETLSGLLISINVKSHPGKLDISDILAKATVKTPSIMVGWTRCRANEEIAGHYGTLVDFIAYIAVEDFTDLAQKRVIKRDEVGQAIGDYILKILHHDELSMWGLKGVSQPEKSPAPEFKPIFTSSAYDRGVAYYAVAWSQLIIDLGQPITTNNPFTLDDDGELYLDPEAELEPEINALFKTFEEDAQP